MGTTDRELDGMSSRIDTEAAQWWSRLELGSADPAAFESWREADPRHAIAFARVQASWEALARQDLTADANTLEQARLSRRGLLRAGAMGAACLAAGGAFFTSRALAWDRAVTGVGEFRRIKLPDASVLELNTDTEVSWHFTGEARKIRLEKGEIAMMLVSGAPITLLTQWTDMALSPGQFNARLSPARVGLMVMTGKATIGGLHGRPAPTVGGGQSAQLTPAGVAVAPVTPEARAVTTAWQSGDIIFADEPLQSAVDDYNRYLATKIIVDPRLRGERVGGRFTTSDPEAFLRAVALSLDAGVETRGGAIRIVAKN